MKKDTATKTAIELRNTIIEPNKDQKQFFTKEEIFKAYKQYEESGFNTVSFITWFNNYY